MRTLAVSILSSVLIAGLAFGVAAQQPSGSYATPEAKPAPSAPSDPGSAPKPDPSAPSSSSPSSSPQQAPADSRPDVKVESKTELKSESRDGGSALPGASVERTTVFGLSPTAAVMIAAALLLVVILAIVAMTRTSDTYIDSNRRL